MKCTLNEEFDENCYDNRNVKVSVLNVTELCLKKFIS